MKFILAFFFALFTLIHALPSDTSGHSLAARADHKVVPVTLPNGTRKIELYDHGVYNGALIETENGVMLLDASGHELDIQDDQGLQKRVWVWQVAKQWAKIIAKFGTRVWDFIWCIELDVAWKCGNSFLNCAASGTPPWSCIGGLLCAGNVARKCI